jgi:hypothetical protein
MNFDYDMMQVKVQDMMREAEQRRLADEAQAGQDPYESLALSLEKVSRQISERFARRPQIPVVQQSAEVCCTPA